MINLNYPRIAYNYRRWRQPKEKNSKDKFLPGNKHKIKN